MGAAWLIAAILGTAQPLDCQAAIGPLHQEVRDPAPIEVDGATLDPAALDALRREQGDRVIYVRGGDFRGADFRTTRLHHLCFLGSDLSASDWRGAQAPGIGFIGANLAGARLENARLPRLLLRNSDLSRVDARGATLWGGKMDGGWDGAVDGFRLDDADLRNFRFECGLTIDDGCPIDGEISLIGADLRGANLFRSAKLEGARLDGSEVDFWLLPEIAGTRLEGPIRLRGGDDLVELTPDEVRLVLGYLRPDPEAEPLSSSSPREAPSWAAPGAVALFVDSASLFRPEFVREPLHRRLVPVIVAAAWSRVAVQMDDDLSLAAVGDAIGGNAHLCTLAAEDLRLDPDTGFYSAAPEAAADGGEESRDPIPVLRITGDVLEVWQNGHARDGSGGDFASCGARAGFGRMTRIAVPPRAAQALFDGLNPAPFASD